MRRSDARKYIQLPLVRAEGIFAHEYIHFHRIGQMVSLSMCFLIEYLVVT